MDPVDQLVKQGLEQGRALAGDPKPFIRIEITSSIGSEGSSTAVSVDPRDPEAVSEALKLVESHVANIAAKAG